MNPSTIKSHSERLDAFANNTNKRELLQVLNGTTQHVLVTGATGNQGGAVIQALFALQNPNLKITGLTRDPFTARARNLAAKCPGLHLIAGDYSNPSAIFSACGLSKIDKIFLVQTPPGFPPNADLEEQQGKALIDAAIEHGVSIFVQTTVDRGPNSDTNATDVAHFASKFRIEKHLLERCREASDSKMTFTILRPTVFMENFSGGFMTKILANSLRDGLPADCPIQMISAKDIGWFGAQALVKSDDPAYRNQSLSLAGDELSVEEMQRTYEEVCRRPLPTTFSVVSWALGLMVEGLTKTLRSFRMDGFSADVQASRALHPEVMTFWRWLEEKQERETG